MCGLSGRKRRSSKTEKKKKKPTKDENAGKRAIKHFLHICKDAAAMTMDGQKRALCLPLFGEETKRDGVITKCFPCKILNKTTKRNPSCSSCNHPHTHGHVHTQCALIVEVNELAGGLVRSVSVSLASSFAAPAVQWWMASDVDPVGRSVVGCKEWLKGITEEEGTNYCGMFVPKKLRHKWAFCEVAKVAFLSTSLGWSPAIFRHTSNAALPKRPGEESSSPERLNGREWSNLIKSLLYSPSVLNTNRDESETRTTYHAAAQLQLLF